MTVSFNDIPELLVELLEKVESLEKYVRKLERATVEKADKGRILIGYRAISEHYKITQATIQQWITEGAPLYKKGNAYFCYTNEMDAFLQKNNPFFKTS